MNGEGNTRKNRWVNIQRFLALLFVISISIVVLKYGNEIEKFSTYGYPGIFLVTLLANSTIFFPAPGVALVFGMGSILNPFLVALPRLMHSLFFLLT